MRCVLTARCCRGGEDAGSRPGSAGRLLAPIARPSRSNTDLAMMDTPAIDQLLSNRRGGRQGTATSSTGTGSGSGGAAGGGGRPIWQADQADSLKLQPGGRLAPAAVQTSAALAAAGPGRAAGELLLRLLSLFFLGGWGRRRLAVQWMGGD